MHVRYVYVSVRACLRRRADVWPAYTIPLLCMHCALWPLVTAHCTHFCWFQFSPMIVSHSSYFHFQYPDLTSAVRANNSSVPRMGSGPISQASLNPDRSGARVTQRSYKQHNFSADSIVNKTQITLPSLSVLRCSVFITLGGLFRALSPPQILVIYASGLLFFSSSTRE